MPARWRSSSAFRGSWEGSEEYGEFRSVSGLRELEGLRAYLELDRVEAQLADVLSHCVTRAGGGCSADLGGRQIVQDMLRGDLLHGRTGRQRHRWLDEARPVRRLVYND